MTRDQELREILAKKRLSRRELDRVRELLGWNVPKWCPACGEPAPRDRWCFAVPVCHSCLPPAVLFNLVVDNENVPATLGETKPVPLQLVLPTE